MIRIDGANYSAHRLAFIWMLGEAPAMVDHINQIKTDNSWSNLRPTNHVLNALNSKARSTNILGIKGVTITPAGSYHVRVTPLTGKRISKTFEHLDDAIDFAIKTRLHEHGDFANS